MKIAIMGAGGVGGTYGARLALAGHEVVLIARGAHAEAMQRGGLRLCSDLGDAHVERVSVTGDPREVGAVDLVVLAVKLWDTAAAARAVLPMIGPSTAVMSLQNGIDKEAALAAEVGRERVIGGVAYISAAIEEPGVVRHFGRFQRIVLGELDGSESVRVERIAAAMRLAGIGAEVSADVRRAVWEKFVFLTAHAAVTAVTRQPIGAVREHPATRALVLEAMREGEAVARAEGVEFADGFAAQRMAFVDALARDSRASMAQDLLRGKRLELEWLNGALLRRAERHGLAVPVHRTLYAALAPYAGGAP